MAGARARACSPLWSLALIEKRIQEATSSSTASGLYPAPGAAKRVRVLATPATLASCTTLLCTFAASPDIALRRSLCVKGRDEDFPSRRESELLLSQWGRDGTMRGAGFILAFCRPAGFLPTYHQKPNTVAGLCWERHLTLLFGRRDRTFASVVWLIDVCKRRCRGMWKASSTNVSDFAGERCCIRTMEIIHEKCGGQEASKPLPTCLNFRSSGLEFQSGPALCFLMLLLIF